VYPCDFYVLDKYRLGGVHDDSFDELSARAAPFLRESTDVHESCKTCEWAFLCGGGCRRNREPFQDGKPALNIYCAAYRDFFPYAYPRMVQLANRIRGG
jgi:uncharacterized protein